MTTRQVGFKVGLIVILAILFLLIVVAFVHADSMDPHQIELLKGKDEVIALLKWVGGIVVTGMASTIGLLYRDLAKSRVEVNALARRAIEAIEARGCHKQKEGHQP